MSAPKQRILDTAGYLFMTKGYELVGINEIIETADVARATFYHHFKSKESLCLAWLNNQRTESEANNIDTLKQCDDAAERLRKKYKRLHEHLSAYDYRGCPFSNTKVMAPESTEISTIVKEYKEMSAKFWIRLAEDAGKDETIGRALFLLYSGVTVESQNASDHHFIDTALATSLQLLGAA